MSTELVDKCDAQVVVLFPTKETDSKYTITVYDGTGSEPRKKTRFYLQNVASLVKRIIPSADRTSLLRTLTRWRKDGSVIGMIIPFDNPHECQAAYTRLDDSGVPYLTTTKPS